MRDEKEKKEFFKEDLNKEEATITPTMIDESDHEEIKRRDLSAIIPKGAIQQGNGIELVSRDNTLKSDGCVTIGLMDQDGTSKLIANATLPESIDVAERKKLKQKGKLHNKKEKKLLKNKVVQRIQNSIALGSLILIIFLGAFFYWVKNRPTDADFKPLTVEVELGDELPIRTSSYVKPGIGKEVDELQYGLDTSKVILEEVGSYEFSVTHNGITKKGYVNIVDTTPPELEVRELKLLTGMKYTASQFVSSCSDPSGCNYSFQYIKEDQGHTAPGTYVVHVIATDAYQNVTMKNANLYIRPRGSVRKYTRKSPFDFKVGYEVQETYTINLDSKDEYGIMVFGTYEKKFIYQDADKYQKAEETYNGEPGYKCYPNEQSIILTESVQTIGSNYSAISDIHPYLIKEGYREIK